ncbi:MAG: DUF4350 domain-containing protein [Myxococcota bacterium]
MSRRILLAAVALWTLVGAGLVVFAPQERALDPDQALVSYGARRTSFSAAPGGVLALYRTLGQLGFSCSRATDFALPEASALFVIEPVVWFSEDEAREVLQWVSAGGHLIYAPTEVEASFDDDDGEAVPLEVEDPLLARVPAGRRIEPDTRAVEVGAGRIVVLEGGGVRLSNEALFAAGILPEMGWLRFALEGVDRVYFDEARAGAMLSGGLISTLLSGRYQVPLVVLLFAGALALWSIVIRVRPAAEQAEQRTGSSEGHVRALARLMAIERRDDLARATLLDGARERFRRWPILSAELDRLDPEASLIDVARTLEALELRLEAPYDSPTPARSRKV